MRSRPILFSAPMVRALLDGRKTQTRRVVKPQPSAGAEWQGGAWHAMAISGQALPPLHCPYGEVGDQLWVKETWRALHKFDALRPLQLARDRSQITYVADPESRNPLWAFGKTRVSIHMPRWASRIALEITSVRAEQLLRISTADVYAEGAIVGARPDRFSLESVLATDRQVYLDARSAFRGLWESINGPESWSANPWVWVIEFRRLHEDGGVA